MKDLQSLVIDYKEGNESLINEIFNQCEDMLHNMSHKFIKTLPNETYEDLFQDASIVLLKCLRSYEPERGVMFSTFLYSCIKNSMINKYNKSMRDKDRLMHTEDKVRCKDENINVMDTIAANINVEDEYLDTELMLTIDELKEKYINSVSEKKANILKDIYTGMKFDDIAAKNGITKGYITKVNNEMLGHLKNQLKSVNLVA